MGGEGLAQRAGLLVDLLEHKVRVAALFGSLHVPVHMDGLEGALHAVGIEHAGAVSIQHGDLLVVQQLHLAGVGNQRRDVAGDDLLALGKAQHKGAVLAGAIEGVRLSGAQHAQRVAALQHALGLEKGGEHVAIVEHAQQVRNDLRVRLGNKHASLGLQHRAQLVMIFDDAVVDDGDAALHVRMGMGVDVAGFAVGCPAGMADTDAAGQGSFDHTIHQVLQPSLGLAELDHAVLHHGDACAVIAAILQPGQTLQQDILRLTGADITNNAAHKHSLR